MKIAVTGAFGYSGRQIAKRLLAKGYSVITLTNTVPPKDPFDGAVPSYPLDFNNPAGLESAMADCDVFINTYWVRFNYGSFNHRQAVENTGLLFRSACSAGVKRIIHTSIANPDKNSPFEYYRGKAQMEEMLRETNLPCTIVRPTVIFGLDDILINNIAWTLRHFPIVGYFGNGQYRIRPIHVFDFAELVVNAVEQKESAIIDAVGPEDYTYLELLRVIGRIIGVRRLLLPVPRWLGYYIARLIGWWHHDVFLTWPEIGGLMSNLLTSNAPETGNIKLSEWFRENADSVGQHYASELARRKR